jgi:hypothetical protein
MRWPPERLSTTRPPLIAMPCALVGIGTLRS